MKRFVLILSVLLASAAAWAQGGRLENSYFYFDNPDGTIESYPEYIDERLQNRAMSISSTKYKQKFASAYNGPYEGVFDLLFGQQTRTHVFVFSGGQAAAKPTTLMTTYYSSAILGLFAGLWDAMQEKCAAAGPVIIMGNYKDGLSTSKPEECTFMGCEAIHWVSKLDMSKSPFMVAVGMPLQFIFEQYCYYEPKLDRTVGVVFQYTDVDLNAPVSDDIKVYSTAVNIMRDFYGWGPGKNRNGDIEPFKRRDMIDFFKQHFHLKNPIEPEDDECDDAPQLLYLNGGKTIRFIQCGDTIDATEQVTNPRKRKRSGDDIPKDSLITKDPELPVDTLHDSIPKIEIPEPPVQPRYGGGASNNAKAAVVVLPQGILRPTAENNRYMFFLENNWSPTNAVVAISKQTGQISDYVPSKQKAQRGTIQYIGAYGEDLYLAVEGKGIVKYDGKSVATSQVVAAGECEENGEKAAIIFSPNGRYMAAVGSECSVYDVQQGYKRIKHVSYDAIVGAILTNDGDLLRLIGSTLYIARNDGSETSEEDHELFNLFNMHPVGISLMGDNMYIMGGGVVAVSNVKQLDWHRGARLPESVHFNNCGYMSADGIGVGGLLGADGRVAFFTSDAKQEVFVTKELETNIKNQWGGFVKVTYMYGSYVDANQNCWLKQDERNFVIYNRAGIRGYDDLLGKYTQYKR